jgi:sulfur carrier protein ThiS
MSRPSDSTRADARTITIAVTFFADLRRFLPRGAEGPQRYTVPEGATAADLLVAIGVETGAEVTIAVDGELAGRETPLRDGADVMLLNPMEGGAAAAGEATTKMEGGAAAAGEATSKTARRPPRWKGEPQPQARRPFKT